MDSEASYFSGFREEKTNMRRIVNVEKKVRCMKELLASILDKQEKLFEENQELRTANREMKDQLEEIKRENNVLLEKCKSYEAVMKGLGEVNIKEQKLEAVGESKLEEWKKTWEKKQENEKVIFAEVVKKQIQEKTKDTVIQVIKEKEELVRDTVDKKKCMVIFGLPEKKNC